MKVAVLNDYFIGTGGGEKWALELTKYYKAPIYTYKIGETYPEIKNFKVFSTNKTMSWPLRIFKMKKYFSNLDLSEYDAVLAIGLHTIFAALKNDNVFWVNGYVSKAFHRDYSPYIPKYNKIKDSVIKTFNKIYFLKKYKKTLKKVRKIFAISKYHKRLIEKKFNAEPKLLYGFVDTEKFYYKKSEGYYLSVGRLADNKRVDILIEAFKGLEENLKIVGDGPERERLEKLAEGNPSIEFLGIKTGKELYDLYAKCKAFCFTSYYEDFGFVPIEALASGKPVITVKEGALTETITKDVGWLVETDPLAFREVVIKLRDKDLSSMRKVCQKRAKLFTKKEYFKKLDKFLDELL